MNLSELRARFRPYGIWPRFHRAGTEGSSFECRTTGVRRQSGNDLMSCFGQTVNYQKSSGDYSVKQRVKRFLGIAAVVANWANADVCRPNGWRFRSEIRCDLLRNGLSIPNAHTLSYPLPSLPRVPPLGLLSVFPVHRG
jgi:hypothetical protein